MFIVGMLSWWYGTGWKRRWLLLCERFASAADYFSIDTLIKTLFAPYKQISAGRVSGSLAVKWQAFIDKLISRCIGATIRFFVMIIGSVWMILLAVFGFIELLLWPLIPLLPILGIVMTIVGWVPTWT